ncbi:hypothetical protein PanWU01x14_019110 [Parasponia andersonii]|uniref:Uncharacterized protein n=1 Tax=Parasponia andersonii TaxID=3476 RepID=A0A2P5DZG9_PARAD|nr:hypothetical protein PanWU01x14_019110 [Parasponia andersonii]
MMDELQEDGFDRAILKTLEQNLWTWRNDDDKLLHNTLEEQHLPQRSGSIPLDDPHMGGRVQVELGQKKKKQRLVVYLSPCAMRLENPHVLPWLPIPEDSAITYVNQPCVGHIDFIMRLDDL